MAGRLGGVDLVAQRRGRQRAFEGAHLWVEFHPQPDFIFGGRRCDGRAATIAAIVGMLHSPTI